MARLVLLQPFDAIAGSQRIAMRVADVGQIGGNRLDVHLGFGTDGFVSRHPSTRVFMRINNRVARKLLYPLWILALLPRMLRAALSDDVVWANTVYAAPCVLPLLVLAPRQVIVHVHELNYPRVLNLLLRYAARRGASLISVSRFHQNTLPFPTSVLQNCVSIPNERPGRSSRNRVLFVGTTSNMKGFPLFIAVARLLECPHLQPVAYLPPAEVCDPSLLESARSAGIEIRHGETDPSKIFLDGFLTLLCTDPLFARETFSLVAAESVAHLVPVGSAGTEVAHETAGHGLAFDVPSRVPELIAAEIRDLQGSPLRYAELVAACERERGRFAVMKFDSHVQSLISAAGRLTYN